MESTSSDTRPRTRAPSFRVKFKDPPKTKTKLSKKEYQKKYRENMKSDKERYEAYRAVHNRHVKRRREQWTDEQKERNRELQRERQRKYRQKKQQQCLKPVKPVKKKMKGLTTEEQNQKREKNRKSAQKMRDKYSHQKRTAVNAKRMQRYWAQKEQASKASTPKPHGTPTQTTAIEPSSYGTPRPVLQQSDTHTAPYPTKTALKYADYRLKQNLCSVKSVRLSHTLNSSIKAQDTPTKSVLKDMNVCISPTSNTIKTSVENVMKEVTINRNKASTSIKRKLLTAFPSDIRNTFEAPNKKKEKPQDTLYSREKPKKDIVETCLDEYSDFLPSKNTVTKKDIQKKMLTESISNIHRKVLLEKYQVSQRTLYHYKPKNTITSHNATFRQCLCQICFNVKVKVRTFNMCLDEKVCVEQLLNMTMCPFQNEYPKISCVRRDCDKCGCERVKEIFLIWLNRKLNRIVSFSEWNIVKESDGSRIEKVIRRMTLRQLLHELFDALNPFALHQFNSKWQRSQYKLLKSKVPPQALVLTLDFAENYLCKVQDESQSAYWPYTQITLHPVVATFKCPSCFEPIVHHLVFLSDELKHDAHIVNIFFKKTVDFFKAIIDLKKVFIFSDGAASQYKSKMPFYYLATSPVPAEKIFFGSRHGKSECDAVGGTVESLLTSLAASQSDIIINDANSAFQECVKRFKKSEDDSCGFPHKFRNFFLVSKDEVKRKEPGNLKTIPGTRSLHHIQMATNNTFGTRKLACFCDFCLLQIGSACENIEWVDDWKYVNLNAARERYMPLPNDESDCNVPFEVEEDERAGKNEAEYKRESIQTSTIVTDVQHKIQNDVESEKEGGRVKLGLFYLIPSQGKDYVGQIRDKDQTFAKVYFMKWRNGQLQWGDDDISWKTFDCIGPEVKLTLNERASSQRVQIYTYSIVSPFM